jgi:hypothetical protein
MIRGCFTIKNTSLLSLDIKSDDRVYQQYLVLGGSYKNILNIVAPMVLVCPMNSPRYYEGYCDRSLLYAKSKIDKIHEYNCDAFIVMANRR